MVMFVSKTINRVRFQVEKEKNTRTIKPIIKINSTAHFGSGHPFRFDRNSTDEESKSQKSGA